MVVEYWQWLLRQVFLPFWTKDFAFDFDRIKVEALDVMKLSKGGIVVPETAIYYNDDDIANDEDFEGHSIRIDTPTQQEDGHSSVDDFLYVRCAAVAEGKWPYYNVLNNPSDLSADIDFEHLLSVAADARKLKTGRVFDYFPIFNYETKSIMPAWN